MPYSDSCEAEAKRWRRRSSGVAQTLSQIGLFWTGTGRGGVVQLWREARAHFSYVEKYTDITTVGLGMLVGLRG